MSLYLDRYLGRHQLKRSGTFLVIGHCRSDLGSLHRKEPTGESGNFPVISPVQQSAMTIFSISMNHTVSVSVSSKNSSSHHLPKNATFLSFMTLPASHFLNPNFMSEMSNCCK